MLYLLHSVAVYGLSAKVTPHLYLNLVKKKEQGHKEILCSYLNVYIYHLSHAA